MRRVMVVIALVVIGLTGIVARPAYAADLVTPACNQAGVNTADPNAASASGSVCDNPGGQNATGVAAAVVNTLLYALGIVAVVMIIIGGFRYVLSAGDASQIKSAKNTITYAIIGLIIAILGVAIAHFVVGKV